MEVRWSLPAAEDLERICEWIARDNPEAARRVARTIFDGCGSLKQFPNLGRAAWTIASMALWTRASDRTISNLTSGKKLAVYSVPLDLSLRPF
jgi:plasmid stabilization system protein ParE